LQISKLSEEDIFGELAQVQKSILGKIIGYLAALRGAEELINPHTNMWDKRLSGIIF
jgi:hypothetical protein